MKTERQFGLDILIIEETIDFNSCEIIDVDEEILRNMKLRLENEC